MKTPAHRSCGIIPGKKRLNSWVALSLGILALVWFAAGWARAAEEPDDTEPLLPLLPAMDNFPARFEYLLHFRTSLVSSDILRRFSAKTLLSSNEQRADQFLNALRREEMKACSTNPFPPACTFSQVKTNIEGSAVFKALRRMPKGGALHVHAIAAGRTEWILTNLLTRTNCYVRWLANTTNRDHGKIRFLTPAMLRVNPHSADYQEASQLARSLGTNFVPQMSDRLTLDHRDPPDLGVWDHFAGCFDRVYWFITYRPVFVDYLTDAMRSFVEDGAPYVELRTKLDQLYDLSAADGDTNIIRHDTTDFLRACLEVRDRVRAEICPEFDLKLIISDWRGNKGGGLTGLLSNALQARVQFPNLVIGYDLVGEEDPTTPTQDRLEPLFTYFVPLTNQCRMTLPFYFHDGESAWATDDNLVDAVLLGSKRLGHAFNLFRFPALQDLLPREDIALELCPISNQMLRLMRDLRIHPASGYLNAGVQAVLSPDDPSILGNPGLSYDFYEAYMGWNLNLADLKKLAQNAIDYSGRAPDERQKASALFQQRWGDFIQKLASQPATQP